MRNIERSEVINALVKLINCSNEYNVNCFRKDTGFDGSPFSNEFTEWVNSEYIKLIKITKDEYCILNNLSSDYSEIKRSLEGYLGLNKDGIWYSFIMYDHLFPWLSKGITVGIKYIINNCEITG